MIMMIILNFFFFFLMKGNSIGLHRQERSKLGLASGLAGSTKKEVVGGLEVDEWSQRKQAAAS